MKTPPPLVTAAPALPRNHATVGKPFLVIAMIVLALLCAVGAGGIWFLVRMYQTLPTFDQLQSIEQPRVSRVIGADNSVIHEFSIERRFQMQLQDMPPEMIHAVSAIEDRRFFSHWGIDIKRIFGAAVVNVIRGASAQGGSTLTQQLARNLYLSHKKSMVRKIREALTAVQLESSYTKNEILELYLNQVYLGAGVFGVEAAAQRYFSKSITDCDVNECATIAGIIQLPEHYRPDLEKNTARITQRRNAVLRAMLQMGRIDKATFRTVSELPVPSEPQKPGSRIAPYFVEMVRQEAAARFGDNTLYNGGLTIYTTLDPLAQDSAESAVRTHLPVLQQRCNGQFLDSSRTHRTLKIARDFFLAHFDSLYNLRRDEYARLPDSVKLRIAQVSAVALDAETGAIRVLIGGRDFDESKFNRVVQARRQPGSAIKPLVYAAAIEQGMTPATVILDQPITLTTPEGEWRPENYGRTFHGPVTMRYALAKSINIVPIQVLIEIGADKVIDMAQRLGLKQRLNPVPSLAIGACEATPMEMTVAYAAFANTGYRVSPYCIERIESHDKRVLYEHEPGRQRVISHQTAYLMASMLTDVVIRGTGAQVPGMGFTRQAGGKTGTTNDYSDAWFVGFTPQIVCGVWVGVDERRSLGHGVTGARGTLPIWVPAMKALHRDLAPAHFSVPDSITAFRLCETSNLLATQFCPAVRTELLCSGSITDSCATHRPHGSNRGTAPHNMFGTTRKRPPPDESRGKRKLMF